MTKAARFPLPALLAAALLPAVPCDAAALAPENQATQTVGLEVEGLLNASCAACTLKEKFELAGEGVTYELDQVDRAKSAHSATAEIVTVPKPQSKAGLQALLELVANAYFDAPARGTFKASADFGGGADIENVRISKGNGTGAAQTNLTIPASKLIPDTDTAANKLWTELTNDHAKVVPLVKGARELADLLSKDNGSALHGHQAQKDRVRLWMFDWLTRLAHTVELGKGTKGYAKDYHGYTIKIQLDPVSHGLDAAAGTAFTGLSGTTTPTAAKVLEVAKKYVAESAGAEATTSHWPAHPLPVAVLEQALATERPLAARLVGSGSAKVFSPIVELRQTNSPLNQKVGKAISAVIKGGKSKIASTAATQATALQTDLAGL